MAFRDDTRITLGSQTRFRVDNFVYDARNAGEGRFLASILRGSVRALTGLIAKANNQNVGFSTATATIGIRGTGFDVTCTGACAGEPGGADTGMTLFTWLGSIAVGQQGQTALQVLQAGQGPVHSRDGRDGADREPAFDGNRAPRPRRRAAEVVFQRQRFRQRRRPVRLRARRPHRDRERERSAARARARPASRAPPATPCGPT
ncbi:hypothetical protein HK414_05735 [Ramlibacter terrae]|uniref:FecR protein domain-containing protein n=1 Tax=Ramlibacter terrae TaxID=2732511 RepID=A0ABX6P894_9BURK|nr:hypothetical protein HK414_05735 [Ramlibacter terrae]